MFPMLTKESLAERSASPPSFPFVRGTRAPVAFFVNYDECAVSCGSIVTEAVPATK
jgi:hypothetical protein